MKERPILCDAESVRGILSGYKDKTRRTVGGYGLELLSSGFSPEYVALPENECSPYGYAGDLLWVRETWACDEYGRRHQSRGMVYYRADAESMGAWRPSIFMPRWASRITLRLTDVRIERLQDITADDIRAEGLTPDNEASLLWRENLRAKWIARWDGINRKRAPWSSNPWVWALSFERVEE